MKVYNSKKRYFNKKIYKKIIKDNKLNFQIYKKV